MISRSRCNHLLLERFYQAVWPALLILAVIAITIIDVVGVIIPKIGRPFSNDFTVYWTAARSPLNFIYDAGWMTQAQAWITKNAWPRPYINPPSFLFLTAPFGLMPHWPALILWLALTGTAFAAASTRIAPAKAILLAMATPASLTAFIGGQAVILTAAALVGAMSLLRTCPTLAGLLFGIAATIKPQAVMLIPLALIAGREYRALGVAALSGMVIGLLSLVIHGPGVWADWLMSLPEFLRLITESGFINNGISPRALAHDLELDPSSSLLLALVAGALALMMVWTVFRTTEDVRYRIVATVVGGVLCSPYAWQYELLAATPALAAIFLDRHASPVLRGAAILLLSGLAPTVALFVAAGALIWTGVVGQFEISSNRLELR